MRKSGLLYYPGPGISAPPCLPSRASFPKETPPGPLISGLYYPGPGASPLILDPLGAVPIFIPGADSLIENILELYAPGPGPSGPLLFDGLPPI